MILVLLNLPVEVARRARAGIRNAFEPFEHSLTLVWSRGIRLVSGFTQAAELAAENARLQQDLTRQRFRIRELQHMQTENQTLRRQLGFAILSPRRLELAEVIARGDLSGFWRTVRVNKGHADGILPDMAVVTADGLVGRTYEVSAQTADILLITDPNSRVSCQISGKQAIGIMRGAGAGGRPRSQTELLTVARPTELNYLPSTETVALEDVVVTSGLGYVFPEGLRVGRVARVEPHESGLYQRARVVPAADLQRLRYVFIVME